MERVNWQRLRDILIVVIGVGVVGWAAFSILGIFVHAIVLLLLAMAVAFLVTPLVDFLNKRMPRVLAALAVYLVILAILAGLGYALVFSFIEQVTYFSTHLPVYVQNIPNSYTETLNWLVKQGVPLSSINKAISMIEDQANSFALSIATNLVSIVQIIGEMFVNISLLVVLSFYLALDGNRLRTALLSVAPKRSMPHLLLFQDSLNRVVGNYIRGQLTLAAIIGVLAGVGSYFLGLSNFALIIGALAFLFETIPMLGPALASIPAILISLLLPDPFPRTFAVFVYFVIIQVFEGNVLGPRIVGHAVGLHPVVSILALIVGVQLFGAFGALLATPILAAVWVVVASLYRSFRGESPDELLAKTRTSWIRRRSNHPHHRFRKGSSAGTRTSEDKTLVERPNGVAPTSDEVKQQEKGISSPGKIEHTDLLRPVPRQEEKTSTGSGRLSEYGDDE